MGVPPDQPLKTRQLRERYRLQRRRQTLMLLGCVGVAVLFAGIVAATVLMVRSCAPPAGRDGGPLIAKITKRTAVEGEAEGLAQLAGANSFRNAPWLLAVDDQRLYVASDSQKRGLGEANYPIDAVAAFEFGAAEPQWELELEPESQASGLLAAGGNACLYTHHLADPPYLELRGLAGNDGTTSWEQRLDLAEQVKVSTAGGLIVVNYFLPDGYRIISYRGADGQRGSLGLKVPLRGLITTEIDQAMAQEFELYTWDAVVGYSYYNVAGIANAVEGKLLYENALDYYIYDMAYSAGGKRAYALSGGETSDSYIVWELARDGIPLELYRFLSQPDGILLLAADDYLAVVYKVSEGSSAGSTKLVVFKHEFGAPQVEYVFTQVGAAADIAWLPGGEQPGRFIFALDGGMDGEGWPTGKAELYLVDPEAQEPVQLLAQLKQPVQYLWTLKQDCLAICRGGQVYGYDAGSQTLNAVVKLKYELALPLASPSNGTLALASASQGRWQGDPGRPLVVTALK